jgi:hypothetical protein
MPVKRKWLTPKHFSDLPLDAFSAVRQKIVGKILGAMRNVEQRARAGT